MSRGKRESHWLVIRRCLAIIRRAQRGLASREELIQAVLAQEEPEAYGELQGKALYRRLENDLRRIRDNLMVDLYFDRQAGGYVIKDTWLPLLDLPDEDLATIAWLEETFGLDSPQHDEVHALLGRLRLYLGTERLAALERCRTALTVDLRQRDEDEIPSAVWDGLTKAMLERRQVELLYLSPQYENGRPRRHVVDPYDYYFDTTRGHYYLRAYCRRAKGPDGLDEPRCYITYRVGRILELTVLPQKLSPLPPPSPRYAVVYELAPQVARLGVTHHLRIEIEDIERRDDGSAVVRGTTDSVFWAIQALMHYRHHCRVLGGPEMLREMRATVQKMAEMYAQEKRSPRMWG
ncbi:MAG: helix-turn-helix transcriptional regulator [Anaerolineae bacterium]